MLARRGTRTGVWDATPQADDIAHIIASHKNFFGAFKSPA